jgi:flagellar FliL protein
MAEDKKDQEEKKEAAPSGKNPLLVVLVLVNTIAIGAVGFFQFQNHKKLNSLPTMADIMKQQAEGDHAASGEAEGGGHGEKKEAGGHGGGKEVAGGEVKTDGLLYPLDPFTANLSQSSGPQRFIRIGLVLKFNKDAKKEEVDTRKPQINDTIINMLNSKKPDELLKKEGKDYLREEIKTSINNFMTDGQVIDIYYVNFQIN